MADTLTAITTFINSPPGQVTAGGALAVMVWKTFGYVETVLKDATKKDIAAWLLATKLESKVSSWPEQVKTLFDRIFGLRQWSWTCVWRSAAITLLSLPFSILIALLRPDVRLLLPIMSNNLAWMISESHSSWTDITQFIVRASMLITAVYVVVFLLPDYVSLLKSRWTINLMVRNDSPKIRTAILVLDLLGSLGMRLTLISLFDVALWIVFAKLMNDPSTGSYLHFLFDEMRGRLSAYGPIGFMANVASLSYPILFCWFWMVLYGGSGLLLKIAHRFDIGFEWFNRRFDIEKKPLQSIGLVAGALVAVIYWAAVIVNRVV